MNIIFFGSFLEYSVEVLKGLLKTSEFGEPIKVVAVVTTPPLPAGRKQELQFTHVHKYAESLDIPVFAPDKLTLEALAKLAQFGECEYFVTAGYGKLLPAEWLEYPKLAALNVHFSLLPKYRGANPGEWALISGETKTGISVIEMSAQFDTGAILAQAESTISKQDTRETVYRQLYSLGGQTIREVLQTDYVWRNHINTTPELITTFPQAESKLTFSYPPVAQEKSPTPYARRLTKEDSWVSAKFLSLVTGIINLDTQNNATQNDMVLSSELSPFLYSIYTKHWQSQGKSLVEFFDHAVRALTGFPCIWSSVQTNKGEKRIKMYSGKVMNTIATSNADQTTAYIPETVQIEGQQKAHWNQLKNNMRL